MDPAVGERVRHLRRQRGLSQRAAGGDVLSASYVSLIESGKRAATPAALAVLAEQLDTSVDYLRDGVSGQAREDLTLRLRYAELALVSGEATDALRQFESLADDPAAERAGLAEDARWGRARGLEAVGRLEDAVAAYGAIATLAVADPRARHAHEAVVALARCSLDVGDLGRAIDVAEQGVARMVDLGLSGSRVHVELASTLVGAYHQRGDLVAAQIAADTLIEQVDAGQSRELRGLAYWNASLVAESSGRLGDAIDLAESALALLAEGSEDRALARLSLNYAWLLMRGDASNAGRAGEVLLSARSRLLDFGSKMDLAACDTELARVELLEGRPLEAVDKARDVVNRLNPDQPESVRAQLLMGEALLALGEEATGKGVAESALESLERLGASREAAEAWRDYGDLMTKLGDPTGAANAYQRALARVGILGHAQAPSELGRPIGSSRR